MDDFDDVHSVDDDFDDDDDNHGPELHDSPFLRPCRDLMWFRWK